MLKVFATANSTRYSTGMRTVLFSAISIFLLSGCIGGPLNGESVEDAGSGSEGAPGIWAPDGRVTIIELGDAPSGDAPNDDALLSNGDEPDVCEPATPSYYTAVVPPWDGSATGPGCVESTADAGNGMSLPGTYLMEVGGEQSLCNAQNTPAACQCAEQYTCACMMPALWAYQTTPMGSHICGGSLTGCIVDALGVIHVTCN